MGKFNCGDRVRVLDKAKAAPRDTHGRQGMVLEVWKRLSEREYTVYVVQLDGEAGKVELEEYDVIGV